MKIIIAMVVGILISICVVIGIVYVVSESYEKNYIGLWSYESTGKEIKVVKTNDGFYEGFAVGDDDPSEPEFVGKYDSKRKILIIHEGAEKNKELFEDDTAEKKPKDYGYIVYDKEKKQIIMYDKANYDSGIKNGTLDLQEKFCLTKVD